MADIPDYASAAIVLEHMNVIKPPDLPSDRGPHVKTEPNIAYNHFLRRQQGGILMENNAAYEHNNIVMP